jgi:[ribosomal protein S5]-alanine N-acetyltransferase
MTTVAVQGANVTGPAEYVFGRRDCYSGGMISSAAINTAVDGLILRPWRPSDLHALVRYANNRNIWINLKDRFPFPYTEADGRAWIAHCAARAGHATSFALEWRGEAIGGFGLDPHDDVHRVMASVGYWLAEPFWGRGFATHALRAFTEYAFATFDLWRLQATVFDWNVGSARVLEKVGYTLEGRMRRSIIKDGRIADTLLYARLRP